MTEDYILEYWIESVSTSLEEMDKLDLFTPDDIKLMAEAMIISADQEGMAFGYDAIPNPQLTAIEFLEELYESRNKVWERNEAAFIREIANVRNISTNGIYVENGKVKYLMR
jgi:glycine/D-amino acid oxidase-like deaminating enzyme